MAARLLSERESAVLREIGRATDRGSGGWGSQLTQAALREGIDTSEAGAHQSAASLVRKRLAYRAGTRKLMWYRITQLGRDAIRGDMSGEWRVRPEPETET